MVKLREPMPIATLDLRIDYMRPAKPHQDIIAECECVRVTHEVAFVRGTAHQGDATDPIALCTGAFMLIRGGVHGIPVAP
jgi:acyl-coenzyme A thioesterase PaaI-like protein